MAVFVFSEEQVFPKFAFGGQIWWVGAFGWKSGMVYWRMTDGFLRTKKYTSLVISTLWVVTFSAPMVVMKSSFDIRRAWLEL